MIDFPNFEDMTPEERTAWDVKNNDHDIGSFLNPITSATQEEAIAKYRAQPFYLPNGKTVTLGEVQDMDPEDRRAWFANTRDSDPDDIE